MNGAHPAPAFAPSIRAPLTSFSSPGAVDHHHDPTMTAAALPVFDLSGPAARQGARAPVPVAFIHLNTTPYWQSLHRDLARALPEVELWNLYTRSEGDQPWELQQEADVRPVRFFHPKGGSPRMLKAAPYDFITAARIIRWLRDHRVKAVVLFGYNDVIRLRLLVWCRLHAVACFVASDSNIRDDIEHVRRLKRIVKNAYVRAFAGAVTGAMPFGSTGIAYFRRYGVARHRIFPLPPGPDYDRFASITREQVDAKLAALRLDPARKRLLYVGRLVDRKRVDLLVDAFVHLASDRPNWDLLIVGNGPERDALIARIPTHLRPRATFAGFVNDPVDIACVYRCANALVLPSSYEPWGLVVNEAAASGLAIVTSDVVGASGDLVIEGFNGRTFKSGSADALHAALVEVTHPDRIDRMQTASGVVLAAFRERFDPARGLRNALLASHLLEGAAADTAPAPDARPARAPDTSDAF